MTTERIVDCQILADPRIIIRGGKFTRKLTGQKTSR